MMDSLIWGLQTTGLGMGLVFGLLALLWGLLSIVLRLDQPPVPAPEAVSDVDEELVAAILVATLAHRALRRREAAPVMRSYWPGSLLYASRWLAAGRARQNHSWQRKGR